MSGSVSRRPERWVLAGAVVHPEGAARSTATALGVRGERVEYVGDDAGARAWLAGRGPVVDAPGLHVYSGLVDAHAHLHGLGRSLEEVSLDGARSLAEVLARVAEAAAALPPDAWVMGRGWNEAGWPGAPAPTAALLDQAVAGRPAYLTRQDGHAAWVSSAALARAALTRTTADPEGGRIARDAAGAPSGVLVDNAMALVARWRPVESDEVVARRLGKAQEACARVGLTGVHDMGASAATLAALRRMDAAGALTLRVHAALDDDPALRQAELPQGPELAAAGRQLTVRAVKLFADGALGSRGAALLDDYADEPGNRGLLLLSPAALEERIAQAARAGFQVCVHAIGDRGNRVVLEALEKALAPWRGDGRAHPLRPRIEHCQVLHPDDVGRLAALGAVASMQPVHCTSDLPWLGARLGAQRARGAYAWRDLLERGVALAFGSDFPVEPCDPRLGLHAAVTRQTPEGVPPGGWLPEQRLTIDEAVRAFTGGAAFAVFRETELGRIAPGCLADFTILGLDLDAGSPAEVLSAPVWATVVGGCPAFAAEAERWSALA